MRALTMIHQYLRLVTLVASTVVLSVGLRVEKLFGNAALGGALNVPAEVSLGLIEPDISVTCESVSTDPEEGASGEDQGAKYGVSLRIGRNQSQFLLIRDNIKICLLNKLYKILIWKPEKVEFDSEHVQPWQQESATRTMTQRQNDS
jgi:hypothetical protein